MISKLAIYTRLSPNCTKPRNAKVTRITPHCVDGDCTMEQTLEIFMPTSRKASCNYAIDSKGRIGCGVDEENRSWCSSNAYNDRKAITVEISNLTGVGYPMTDAAIDAFIALCVDVCKRYKLSGIYYEPDKSKNDKAGLLRITLHRWYANKACPGDYFVSKIPYIVGEVNSRLAVDSDKAIVQAKTGFSDATMDYLEAYKYGSDLLRKLAKLLK